MKCLCDDYVNVYFEKNGDVLMIGTVKQSTGIRFNCGVPLKLAFPYSAVELGSQLNLIFRQVATLTERNIDKTMPLYERATGIKSFKKFSSTRRLVSARFYRGTTIELRKHMRFPDGSYRPDMEEASQIRVSAKSSASEIGEALLKLGRQ